MLFIAARPLLAALLLLLLFATEVADVRGRIAEDNAPARAMLAAALPQLALNTALGRSGRDRTTVESEPGRPMVLGRPRGEEFLNAAGAELPLPTSDGALPGAECRQRAARAPPRLATLTRPPRCPRPLAYTSRAPPRPREVIAV